MTAAGTRPELSDEQRAEALLALATWHNNWECIAADAVPGHLFTDEMRSAANPSEAFVNAAIGWQVAGLLDDVGDDPSIAVRDDGPPVAWAVVERERPRCAGPESEATVTEPLATTAAEREQRQQREQVVTVSPPVPVIVGPTATKEVMVLDWVRTIRDDKELNRRDRQSLGGAILAITGRCQGGTGRLDRSVKEMAADWGMKDETLAAAMRRLESAGYLQRVGRKRVVRSDGSSFLSKTYVYQLTIPMKKGNPR